MTPSRVVVPLGWALIAFGCNALFDIEEAKLVVSEEGGGAGGERTSWSGGEPGTPSAAGGRAIGDGAAGGAAGAAGMAGDVHGNAGGGSAGEASIPTGGGGGAAFSTGGAESTGGSSEAGSGGVAGASCREGEGGCNAGECEEGWESCAENTLKTCVGGQVIERLCPFGCDGVCWECDPDSPGVCGAGNTHQSCSPTGKLVSIACIDTCTPSGCKECVADETECVDSGHVKTCGDDGAWGSPQPCEHQTCVVSKCIGQCAPGESRCLEGNAQVCDAGGQFDTEVCDFPAELCSTTAQGSACRSNPVYRVGNGELLPELPVELVGNRLFLFRLPSAFETTAGVPSAALINLGLIASASPPGLYAKVAVYDDVDGLPRNLVSGSQSHIPVTSSASGNVAAPSVNEARLLKGNWYWLAVVFSDDAGMAFMPSRGGSTIAYQVVGVPYQVGFPQSLPEEGLTVIGQVEWNLFVTVRDQRP